MPWIGFTAVLPRLHFSIMIDNILRFWFGDHAANTETGFEARSAFWFGKSAEVDAKIRDRYAVTLQQLVNNGAEQWISQPRGRLAAILVLDQFSRNMYRDDARAFAQDGMALRLVLMGLSQEVDQYLSPLERLFFYLPLEHCESLEVQRLSMKKYRQLCQQSEGGAQSVLQKSLDFAQQHFQIIERFGRFPHRNQILKRNTTAEEQRFLQTKGSSF